MIIARLLILIALSAVAWPCESEAGEAFVMRVRGTRLTLDKGAEAGLEVGLPVTVVRPPEESVIHPLTGENLGSLEIEIAEGEISKVSARASSVRLKDTPLLALRPGDVARFVTLEEKMVMEQEMATETAEKAKQDRQKIRGEASRLSRNIKNVQATIKGLERSIKALRRFDDDVVKPQFNNITRELKAIKEELSWLRETVSLMEAVPIEGLAEGMAGELSEENVEKLRGLIQQEIDAIKAELATRISIPSEDVPVPDLAIEDEMMEEEEEVPIWANPILWVVVLAIGLAAIVYFVYTKFLAGGGDEDDEDDEEDDDEEEEEEDDDEEMDLDIEDEEDDIVVEETS